jgi:hypothetical protein
MRADTPAWCVGACPCGPCMPQEAARYESRAAELSAAQQRIAELLRAASVSAQERSDLQRLLETKEQLTASQATQMSGLQQQVEQLTQQQAGLQAAALDADNKRQLELLQVQHDQVRGTACACTPPRVGGACMAGAPCTLRWTMRMVPHARTAHAGTDAARLPSFLLHAQTKRFLETKIKYLEEELDTKTRKQVGVFSWLRHHSQAGGRR